jgi:AbrB family looped-hinge helix DNA binding protein
MMRITSKGQVTIPKDMRDRFGLQPETEVEFVAEDGALRLVHSSTSQRGRKLVKKMRGMATGSMSTDEIMALTRG